MGIERQSARRQESQDESPEITARKATLERIESMSSEEFESTVGAAKLSEPEIASMNHWRATSEWLTRFGRKQEVRELYFAAKHPSLSRIFAKLNIGLDTPYDSKELAKLDEQEELFSLYDFEQAIEKIQSHLG